MSLFPPILSSDEEEKKRIKYRRNKSKSNEREKKERKNKEPLLFPLPIFRRKTRNSSSRVSSHARGTRCDRDGKFINKGRVEGEESFDSGGIFLFSFLLSLSLSLCLSPAASGAHVAWRNPSGVMGNELWTVRSPPRGQNGALKGMSNSPFLVPTTFFFLLPFPSPSSLSESKSFFLLSYLSLIARSSSLLPSPLVES